MTGPAWSKVRAVAGEAMDLSTDERDAFVKNACAGDSDLRDAVQRLLIAHDGPARRIEPPEVAAAPEPAPSGESLLGCAIGRYTLVRLIGRGGMGAVYEAQQDEPRRRIALKIMNQAWPHPQALRRFREEAASLARLKHPGVAALYEAGVAAPTRDGSPFGPSAPFLAMELVENAQPITEFARARGLNATQCAALMIKVCDAVHHGHQRGVLHRDLKPANILIEQTADPALPGAPRTDPSVSPRIIDFGVARAIGPGAQDGTAGTVEGQLIGTVAYMSPEQCGLGSVIADTRSDVYALGAVLYELTCGRTPIDTAGLTILSAAAKVRESYPVRPSALVARFSSDLEAIVLKALAREQAERYQSAAEFGADLKRFIRSEPVLARPPTMLHQLRLAARRRRPLVVGLAVAAAALVIGAVGMSVGLVRASREAARKERVAQFLKDTLRSADPAAAAALSTLNSESGLDPAAPDGWGFAGTPGQRATVREVLVAAAARLQERFPDDPVTRADLQFLIGRTLWGVSDLPDGADLIRTAADSRVAAVGAADEQTISMLLWKAHVCRAFNEIRATEAALRTAEDGATARLGAMHSVTRSTARALNVLLAGDGDDRSRSEAVLRQRLQLAAVSRSFGPESQAAYEEQVGLAELLTADADRPERLRLARAAYEGLGRTLGLAAKSTHDAAGELILSLRQADSQLAPDDPVESPELLEAVQIAIHCCEASDAVQQDNHGLGVMLAELWLRLGRFDRALPLEQLNLETALRSTEPDGDAIMKNKGRLARTLVGAGRQLAEAEQLAREAAAMERPTEAGPFGWRMWYTAIEADAIRRQGRTAEASTRMVEHLARIEAAPPGGASWCWAFNYTVFANTLIDASDYEGAKAALDKARARLDDLHDERHQYVREWRAARRRLDAAQSR